MKTIDQTFLKMRGWIAYQADIEGEDRHYFLHNPKLEVIINKKEILRDGFAGEGAVRPHEGLSIVEYSKVWPFLMKKVLKFEKELSVSIEKRNDKGN